jgi:cyclic pyranopterin phosphate synthase
MVATAALTHVDEVGRARMVDVTGKPETHRRAEARCLVGAVAPSDDVTAVPDDVLEAARLAGVQAAKATARLIPLCHPLGAVGTDVMVFRRAGVVEVRAVAEVTARTGVEMEALTACLVAGLTIVAAVGPELARVDELRVWHKSGGRSGTWSLEAGPLPVRALGAERR